MPIYKDWTLCCHWTTVAGSVYGNGTWVRKREKYALEVHLMHEVFAFKPSLILMQSEIKEQTHIINQIISNYDTGFEKHVLQLWWNCRIQNVSISTCIGRSFTINLTAEERIQHDICLTSIPVVDATRHSSYRALYHYNHRTYIVALSLLREANSKLQDPYLMNPGNISIEKYRAVRDEHKPFIQTMKEILAWDSSYNTRTYTGEQGRCQSLRRSNNCTIASAQ